MMIRGLIYILLSIFFVATYSCKQNKDLTEEEVINAIRKFDMAWKAKDSSRVDSILAPSYIYFTQSGGLFSRDSVVATAGSSSYILEEMERSGLVVQMYGNTAVVSTRWHGKGIYRGRQFDTDQRCSVILVKHKGKVLILSEHCAPVAPIISGAQ